MSVIVGSALVVVAAGRDADLVLGNLVEAAVLSWPSKRGIGQQHLGSGWTVPVELLSACTNADGS